MSAPPPITRPQPSEPDRDWEMLREQALEDLRALAGETWTDHNTPDPGITVLEAALWALSDLHYRTAHRSWRTWTQETGLAAADGTEPVSGVPLPRDPATLHALAEALATAGLVATIDAAPDELSAITEVVRATRSSDAHLRLDVNQARALVRLVRRPALLRQVYDDSAQVAAVLEAVREELPGADQEAIIRLAAGRLGERMPGSWRQEREAVLRRVAAEQRLSELRRRADVIVRRVGEAADWEGALGEIDDEVAGLGARERMVAAGLHHAPPQAGPESFESTQGRTRHWPPHPLQVRSVEPVTAEDYARLARGAPGVRRAWVVAKQLPGIGWDGRRVTDEAARPGAITVVVEDDGTVPLADEPDERSFLAHVLRHTLGQPVGLAIDGAVPAAVAVHAEVDAPHRPHHDDLDLHAPRRLICDEIGAALVRRCGVTVRAVLHVPVTSNRAHVRQAADASIRQLFATGRRSGTPSGTPASSPPTPGDIEGPWPPSAQAPTGWEPGAAVMVSEILRAIAAQEGVLGVVGVAARREGGDWEEVELPLGGLCVPVLSATCFDLVLETEVGV
jgi:hypothetical protein